MTYRPHTHYCDNRSRGCKAEFECRADPEVDEDGSKHCPYDHDHFECEDCETSRCSECGEILNVAPHDPDCAKATQV